MAVKPNWIKVKDSLPPMLMHVLICYDSCRESKICVGYYDEPYWNHYPACSYASDALLFNVTHWAELPEVPE